LKLALALAIGAALLAQAARAETRWRWSLQGQGMSASGTFMTKDAANADGFDEIIAIAGEANGVAITGLRPAGTSIPGNDGYPVDNLVRTGSPALSEHGFAFSLANGAYANPFYAAKFSPPGHYALLSDPATGKTSEPLVAFTAAIVP